MDHLRPIVDAIGDGVHCHWIASNEITAEVNLLQAIQLCIKRGNLQFINVNVTEANRNIKDKMRFQYHHNGIFKFEDNEHLPRNTLIEKIL